MSRAKNLIESLKLEPHPEGGYYRQLFRSEQVVILDDERKKRQALTAIYYLLVAGQCSRWHSVRSDEVWTFLEGDAVALSSFDADIRTIKTRKLGIYATGTEPLIVIPAGMWQAAAPLGGYALMACMVGPGFEFSDFALAKDNEKVANVIKAMGAEFARLL